MAYSAKVGSFNIDTAKTAGQTQAITGVGFQPKIVLFWWSGSTGTGDTVSGGVIIPGFGAAVSTTERYCSLSDSTDAAAANDSRSWTFDDRVISLATAATVDGIFDLSSLDSDGFTLVVDDQFTIAGRVSYLALGGADLTNVKIGTVTIPASTGNFDTTGVGFQPDALITSYNAVTTLGTARTALQFGIGWATSVNNQGIAANGCQYNVATTNSYGYGYDGECLAGCFTGAGTSVYTRASFVSFLADGFRLNCLEVGTSGRPGFYVALKGGQYSVGALTTRTDGNDIAVTGPGFQPVALLFTSANRSLSTQDVQTDHARMSIGAGTSASERACAAWSDEDNLADTETAYANYDSAVYAHVKDDAIEALMDIKSIDATGFTAVMDDTETAGCWVTYLAIGSAAGVLTGTAAGVASQTGTLTGAGALTGAAAGTCTASGTLTGAGVLTGAAAGTAELTGTLTEAVSGDITGTAAGTATASATLTGAGALAGASTGTATAEGTLTGAGALTGSAAGVAILSGTLTGASALTGSVAGTSTVSGTLTATGALTGAAAGASTVSGTLTGSGVLTGTAAGVATVVGTLTGLGSNELTGSIAGTSTAVGTLTGTGALAGSTAGTASLTATLSASQAIVGTAAGTSTATGTLTAYRYTIGDATGIASAVATLTSSGALTGEAIASATADATLTASGVLIGSVTGTSTVYGTLYDGSWRASGTRTIYKHDVRGEHDAAKRADIEPELRSSIMAED